MLEAAVLCMALNLYHEGLKDEPVDGLFAIAQATLNRAERRPERVCEAVQRHKQFSWTLKPPPVEDNRPWQNAQRVARLSFYMSDFTGGATHFHAIWCNHVRPSRLCNAYWRADMDVAGQWGSHVFYKPRRKK